MKSGTVNLMVEKNTLSVQEYDLSLCVYPNDDIEEIFVQWSFKVMWRTKAGQLQTSSSEQNFKFTKLHNIKG